MCGVCFLLKQRLRRRHLMQLLAQQTENTESVHDIKSNGDGINNNNTEKMHNNNNNHNATNNINNKIHANYSSCDSVPSGNRCDVFHI